MGCDTSDAKCGDAYAPRQLNQNDLSPQPNSNQPPAPGNLPNRDPLLQSVGENDVIVKVEPYHQLMPVSGHSAGDGENNLEVDLFQDQKKNQDMNIVLPGEHSTGPVTPHHSGMKIAESNPYSVSEYEKLSSINQSVKRQQQECDMEAMKVNTNSTKSVVIYDHITVAKNNISRTCK